ncbi:NAD-dependent epimerase/dehydratase family protein [Chryseobacterium sp. Tr-659]|uniref:GDP-mannose 4,6-dehydratase n=1 Tax=Chryseobacterium sp. Tr-659 TaxID=2608340 RepID=UPI001421B395|nr:GDP-mannose 4,6-dehydratase [Chryseobacterium sp. Tr-659]NIF07907.1 NAD-dependent epimerase/dehydratase family protein [Chryseobacterium sp. Tr-659]
MDSLSKKVLITGINGFTGKYLSDHFSSQGHDVFGIVNNKNTSEKNIFSCNLLEKEKLSQIINEIQPDIVIHLAAISFVGHPVTEDFYTVNVIGTQNLLEAVKTHCAANIEKVILASSATVYGNQSHYELSESMCPNPNNHYGISKLAMEQMAKNYFEALPIIITRPFNYTAPGQDINFVIPKITKAFKEKSKTIELGNINVFREYNSIDFVTECYYKLATSDYRSEIVNICSGNTYSLEEVLDLSSKITHHTLEVLVNPNFVRKNEIFKLSGDPTKLYTMIDLGNKKFDLQETLSLFL